MSFALQLEGIDEAELPPVEYRWDTDTEILSATLRAAGVAEGMSGSLDIHGPDGAWLLLELTSGRLASVEVSVWPDVRSVERLAPPPQASPGRLQVPARGTGTAAFELETTVGAVADKAERTIHFSIGARRPSRAVRIARDLLVELDTRSGIAGLWLLNVPPFPASPPSSLDPPTA